MGLYRRSETGYWWMSYTVTVDGRRKQIRESTETTDKEQAKIKLAKRIAGQQAPVKGTVGKLLDGVIEDYELNGYDVRFAHQWIDNHLRPYFGSMRAEAVTKETIRDFQVAKKKCEKPLSNASINRCVALLKRSFNLADVRFPKVEMLAENNVRKGFVEKDEFWVLFNRLPAHQRPVILFCYETGCRIQETLNLKWSQLDWVEGVIRLHPGETKNDQGRLIPCSSLMMHYFSKMPKPCEYIFTYKGKHLTNVRTGWEEAAKCLRRQHPNLLVHDLRRSAVRNMVRSGVPERVAMQISGHLSRSVFDRYNIVSEKDIKNAIKSVEKYHEDAVQFDPEKVPELTEFYKVGK